MPGNPYTPASSRLFYGREDLMRRLLADEQSGQSVVFVGGRRCGKTRTLERLRDYLSACARGGSAAEAWTQSVPDATDANPPAASAAVHWPVHVTLQGRAFGSLQEVLSDLIGSVAESDPPVAELPESPAVADPRGFEAWLRELDGRLAEAGLGGLALLVDEVEEVLPKPWAHDLLALLRRLDDYTLRTRLWFVLAGADGLDRYRHPDDGSPPLNLTRRVFLNDLGYPPRRRMAIEPFVDGGRLPPDDATLRWVDRLAAGNVWLLTHLLEELFRAAPGNGRSQDSLQEGMLGSLEDVLRRWSEPLDEEGWRLYGEVSSHGTVPADEIRTSARRAARIALEYQSLVHRNADGSVELGPALFQTWAFENDRVSKPLADRASIADSNGELPPGRFRYGVALSYAAPQRELAEELDRALSKLGHEVFWDEERSHELWGADLSCCLPETYDREAELVILLVSSEYLQRPWPQLEARTAITRALREGWGALLIVSVDGARLPDVPDEIVRLDLNGEFAGAAERIAVEASARLGGQ